MQTKVLIPTDDNISYAAELLNNGEIIGMPTETVYGLAANAFDENAVEKVFLAKGRPQDNPLIAHIQSIDMLKPLTSYIPKLAYELADRFWPGPLTMIFQKSDIVPLAVTAGLGTVAIRFPSSRVAQKLIAAAGMPLVAPSANISGSPSPTTANHVFTDLQGKIPAIIDGGTCEVGLESTVVLLREGGVTLLRPGAVTVDMLREVTQDVIIADGVLHELAENERPQSPGMKHTHYSPKANVCIIDADLDSFVEYVERHKHEKVGALVFTGEEKLLSVPCTTYGDIDDSIIQAKLLFSALRSIDELGVDRIFARMPDKNGIGLAIYNRLIRAAGFEVITL